MRLDVIIPTYNRHEMLARTLRSLLLAEVPRGLDARVTVVDNNSKDRTREVVEEWAGKFGGRLGYVFETRQGRSPAINAGVGATGGDLVGFIDDDEEVDGDWYVSAHAAFAAGGVDFIGGPCLPRWGAPRPAWLPLDYRGVIGWVEGGDRVAAFDDDYPGILMGGNAVLRRAVLEEVGLYSTDLGRTDKALLSCEDEDLYRRLRAAGARGFYRPDLVIYHHVPPERLTRRYFRRWCFWRGVSRGLMDREHPAARVAYLAGVPRHLYGSAARGTLRALKGGDPAGRFSGELALWDLAGFFHGKHFYRPARPQEHAAAGGGPSPAKTS